jgi:hypothetical protein
MQSKSTGPISAKIKREIAALRKVPDSEVDFSDIPFQDANDSKRKRCVADLLHNKK